MIVGEAPGRREIELGEPFVGRSGLLLDDALHKAGTHRTCVYITNCFKGDVGEGNRNPSELELTEHIGLLAKELDEIKPKRILLLGSVATNEFFPYKVAMKNVVGKSFSEQGNSSKLYPCYHPAYVLRGHRPDIVFSFYSVVEKFVRGV